MNVITAVLFTARHSRGRMKTVHGSMKLFVRSLCSSEARYSYVHDIRSQMDIKRHQNVADVTFKDGRFLVMDTSKGRVLISSKTKDNSEREPLLWTHYKELSDFGVNVEENAVFLRVFDGQLHFAVNVSSLSQELQSLLETKTHGKFISLRASLFNLDGSAEMPLVSQSHSLLDWIQKYKFCVYCGVSLETDVIGIQKKCHGCKAIHYPTLSPVGITLICNEPHNKVLLVRQPVHPPRMFTCIAGFIESGESIEENIKREVAEEVGLEVTNIRYAGSQHWSLPGSRLMIGCYATVREENISLDSLELEEAHWFGPQQVKDALNRVTEQKERVLKNPQDIWIPPPGAIAYSLIKCWLQEHH